MIFFGTGQSKKKCGAIIDIGSGSVLVAIVISDSTQKAPQVVWSHRERAPIKNTESIEQSAKAVMASLVQASMILDSEGRKSLDEQYPRCKITELQCTISAPWSYTVTKTINYKSDKEFEITSELIENFLETIQNQIEHDFSENTAIQELSLKTISKLTMDLSANGYHIAEPIGNKAKEMSISQSHAVAQDYIIDAVDELQDKLLTNVETKKISFILALYAVTRQILNHTYDVCLVDITYEATEIGIVRDGVLSYSTHTAFGSYSLTREISEITGVPLTEAFGYLHSSQPYSFLESLPDKQQADVELVFEAYTERISRLFRETGDSLSIPKQIAVHSDLRSESLFVDLITKAAKRNLKSEPYVTKMTEAITKATYREQTSSTKNYIPIDTGLMISAQFFHTNGQHFEFKHF